ncbi:unnamed protein product [Eretmochelys imbricata]
MSRCSFLTSWIGVIKYGLPAVKLSSSQEPCCCLPVRDWVRGGREERAQMVAMIGLSSCPVCQWEEAVGLQAVIAGGRTPPAGVDTRSPAATSQSRDCLWGGGNPKTDTSW